MLRRTLRRARRGWRIGRGELSASPEQRGLACLIAARAAHIRGRVSGDVAHRLLSLDPRSVDLRRGFNVRHRRKVIDHTRAWIGNPEALDLLAPPSKLLGAA